MACPKFKRGLDQEPLSEPGKSAENSDFPAINKPRIWRKGQTSKISLFGVFCGEIETEIPRRFPVPTQQPLFALHYPSPSSLVPSSSSSVISFHNIRRRRRWGKENNDINNNNWDWQTQSANGGQKFELENLAGTEGICPNLVIFEKHLTDLQ